MRPPAYEVRGEIVARPAADMLLVRHEAVAALGMEAMELMAVLGDPALIDASGARPGDRVRLAVRRANDHLLLVRIDRRSPAP
jgi:Cu/Ag efflux protein CusF